MPIFSVKLPIFNLNGQNCIMEITFRGVRGSYPVAAPHSLRYGGNTSCIEVWAGDTCLIIDAGTGIRTLGKELIARDQRDIHLLISHCLLYTSDAADE